ncbi:hypothetical protein KKG45_11890 [bacterium]|nr:hypothetical protein [bacterium]
MRTFLLAGVLALVTANPVEGRADIRVEDAFLFTLGAGSSVAAHEASHYLVARLQGLDIRPHGLGWETIRPTTAFQMAGLAGNALSSELILLLPRESRGSYFNGWLLINIVEQLTYSTLRYNDCRGDFGPLPESKKRIFAAVFIAEALFAGYRMHRNGQLNIPAWSIADKGRPMVGFGLSRRSNPLGAGGRFSLGESADE